MQRFLSIDYKYEYDGEYKVTSIYLYQQTT